MRKYILHRTFVSKDGSMYPQRAKPYYESELPALALQPAFATLVDDPDSPTIELKPIEKNVVESVYNAVSNPNVIEQHFEPKYHQADVPVEPVREIDLSALNTPDHTLNDVVLGQATASQIAALPYVSKKTADKLVQALADGQVFTTYEDLDKAFKLGFGAKWESTGLLL
ncbi:MAG: hypothetical protein IM613_12815 [Cytophagales bacterium]|nr:hypothetical protein [Cytophagales bacterium]